MSDNKEGWARVRDDVVIISKGNHKQGLID